MKRYFIYAHCRPCGEPFYIGFSCSLKRIFLLSRNKYYNNVVEKYGKENILIYRLVRSSKQKAIDSEIWMIAYGRLQGWRLTNMTNGGEGITDTPRTEETKNKISKTLMGHKGASKGEKRPKEVGDKISKALMGHVGYMLGKHQTDEAKKKISEKNKGKLAGKNHPNYGKKRSEETRNKIRMKALGRPSPLKGRKGRLVTEQTKLKLSKIGLGRPWSARRRDTYNKKYGHDK